MHSCKLALALLLPSCFYTLLHHASLYAGSAPALAGGFCLLFVLRRRLQSCPRHCSWPRPLQSLPFPVPACLPFLQALHLHTMCVNLHGLLRQLQVGRLPSAAGLCCERQALDAPCCRPIFGLIFLFKWRKETDNRPTEAESPDIFFANQVMSLQGASLAAAFRACPGAGWPYRPLLHASQLAVQADLQSCCRSSAMPAPLRPSCPCC